jgi:hypothetical protein
VLVGLIGYMLVPLLLGVKVECHLAALSPQQRMQWEEQQRAGHAQRHRFSARLTDSNRSIRVLTLTETGEVRLEQMAAGDLIRERSLAPDEVYGDEPADVDDAIEDFIDFESATDAEKSLLHVLELLRVHMEDHKLDIFEPEHGREVHLVEVAADDNLDFPEALAAKLIAAA